MEFIKLFEKHSEYETYINSEDKKLPNLSYCQDADDVHFNPFIETRLICKYNVTNISEPTKLTHSASNFNEIEIDGVVQPSVVSSYTFDTMGEHTVKYILANSTQIGLNYPFYECSNLIMVQIPNGVTNISNYAFKNCINLNNVIIPDSVTIISAEAFRGCTSLTRINIPNSVRTFSGGVFEDCTSLTSITIPNSATSISRDAFYGCSNITDVIIGDNVTTIGDNAFRDCTSLTNITSLATTAPTIQSGTFRDIKIGGTLTVPTGSTGYDTWMSTGDDYLGKYNCTKIEL